MTWRDRVDGKIFCNDCIYLKYPSYNCYSCSSNPLIIDTWLKPEFKYANPAEKNKNNDCKEFVSKKNRRNSSKVTIDMKKIKEIVSDDGSNPHILEHHIIPELELYFQACGIEIKNNE